MSKFHSLRKVVKETRTLTCARIIVVENSSDRIAVKVNEHLPTGRVHSPTPRRKFHQDGVTALKRLKLMQPSCLMQVWRMALSEPSRAISLLLCTGKRGKVGLFLRKSRVEGGCPVYTRSENPLALEEAPCRKRFRDEARRQ
jgi:hypothetical protein